MDSSRPANAKSPDEGDRFRGCLLGLACGDAVGTTAEFCRRGSFAPVTDMVGGGVFELKPGEWTDDTSMALCLATSLVEAGGFDPADQMRRYWMWVDEGYLSSNGRCFDVGNATYDALERFRETGDPFSGSTDPWSAGNGCIMRLAPVPMFFHPDREAAVAMSGESARTTHAAAECIEASRLFGGILCSALSGEGKDAILFDHGVSGLGSENLQAIARGDYRSKGEDDVDGSGYVVRSLEAALWCFWRTETFRDAVLLAANLGNDADTTAAVCGQVAGAYYGETGIPAGWLDRVAMREEIRALADRLQRHREGAPPP
jgi:ADP-ribosyl-[dinitrogen reductase] hydrolase